MRHPGWILIIIRLLITGSGIVWLTALLRPAVLLICGSETKPA